MKKIDKLAVAICKMRGDAEYVYMTTKCKDTRWGAENMMVAYDNVLHEIKKLKQQGVEWK